MSFQVTGEVVVPVSALEGNYTKWTIAASGSNTATSKGTGDIAFPDNNGNVLTTDRSSEMINIPFGGSPTDLGVALNSRVANFLATPLSSVLGKYVVQVNKANSTMFFVFSNGALLFTGQSNLSTIVYFAISPSGGYIFLVDGSVPFNYEVWQGS